MPATKKISATSIPSPRTLGALSVTDGGIAVGSIVVRDGSFFSFDVDGVLLDEFDTQRAAVLAFPHPDSKPQRGARQHAAARGVRKVRRAK